MEFIRNLLALIGLLFIALIIMTVYRYGHVAGAVWDLDPRATEIYRDIGASLIHTGNAAEATSWKVKVQEGLSIEDVEMTMRSVAREYNLNAVGELPLYKQVKAVTGNDYRYINIFMFCDAVTAANMIDYSSAFSSYLPCRIALLEAPDGSLWLYTLNLDLMIYGGEPLPPELKAEALRVRKIIREIMDRGARGEF